MPAFHGPALANYLTIMKDITLSYLEKWESMGSFTWFGELKQLTFEIASTLLMGNKPGEMTGRLSQWFTELTAGLFALPLRWSWTTYGKALRARNQLLSNCAKLFLYLWHRRSSSKIIVESLTP